MRRGAGACRPWHQDTKGLSSAITSRSGWQCLRGCRRAQVERPREGGRRGHSKGTQWKLEGCSPKDAQWTPSGSWRDTAPRTLRGRLVDTQRKLTGRSPKDTQWTLSGCSRLNTIATTCPCTLRQPPFPCVYSSISSSTYSSFPVPPKPSGIYTSTRTSMPPSARAFPNKP
eukprot:191991-Chlamydomonas_euryale.AAC.1